MLSVFQLIHFDGLLQLKFKFIDLSQVFYLLLKYISLHKKLGSWKALTKDLHFKVTSQWAMSYGKWMIWLMSVRFELQVIGLSNELMVWVLHGMVLHTAQPILIISHEHTWKWHLSDILLPCNNTACQDHSSYIFHFEHLKSYLILDPATPWYLWN